MKRLEPKHPRAVRWMHWLNVPVLSIMIWSGLLIYWANDVYRVGFGAVTLFHFFPDAFYDWLRLDHRLAEGMAWHFFFMWFFVINGILYVSYTALSGEWRYLLPNRQTFREAIDVVLHDLHLRQGPLPPGKFNGAQRIAYTSIIVMGAGSVLTGLAIYKPVQFAWLTWLLGGYEMARWEHFWLVIGYVLFFLIHITQVIRAGWNNFRAMVTGYELVAADDQAARTLTSPGPRPAAGPERSPSLAGSGAVNQRVASEAERTMRHMTRRSFAVGGVAALLGLGGWQWLRTRGRADGIPWPLRDMLAFNERLAQGRTDGTISAFSLGTTGGLTEITGSPFKTGSEPSGVVEDTSDKYIGVANAGGTPDFQVFTIGTSTSTTPGGLTSFATTTGTNPSGAFAVVAAD